MDLQSDEHYTTCMLTVSKFMFFFLSLSLKYERRKKENFIKIITTKFINYITETKSETETETKISKKKKK